MSDIGHIGSSIGSGVPRGVGRTQESAARTPASPVTDTTRGTDAGDRVEISDRAQALAREESMLRTRNDSVRMDKVEAARAAIADGSLDTDEKLRIAIDRMLQDVVG
mgnify:FL=1